MEGGRQPRIFMPPPLPDRVVRYGKCAFLVGTCGYSYAEWNDCGVYPAGTRSGDMLALYMRIFSVVELNYTWYQMPRAEAMSRMVAKMPVNFRVAAKLTRTLTHEREDDWQGQVRLFRAGIAPLASRLVAVLVQFPPDFERSVANRRYLAGLLDSLYGLPLAVEFRHLSWAVDAVYDELRRRTVSLVAVDVPDFPNLFPFRDVVTNPDLLYVRFHGRNLKGWGGSNMQKKFDYDYSAEELQEWVAGSLQKLSQGARRGVIFFNNHVGGQAPRNGEALQRLLAQ